MGGRVFCGSARSFYVCLYRYLKCRHSKLILGTIQGRESPQLSTRDHMVTLSNRLVDRSPLTVYHKAKHRRHNSYHFERRWTRRADPQSPRKGLYLAKNKQLLPGTGRGCREHPRESRPPRRRRFRLRTCLRSRLPPPWSLPRR